jgi:hypothetical protein
MKKKLLISVLSSLAIVIGAVSFAYAIGTFKASQEGFRPAGEGQAARLTMRVEAGIADPNSDLVPDDTSTTNPSRGGDLTFSIKNTSDVPLRVTKIEVVPVPCAFLPCNNAVSNKSGNGNFYSQGGGDCGSYVSFTAPTYFDSWPTIAPHSTLQVNGTDNNRLGAGMIHLANGTPQGCQGALFALTLNVTASEFVQNKNEIAQP